MNEIFMLLRQVLVGEFARFGLSVRVLQSYSGVATGPPDVPAIIMHHIATDRVGWQSRKSAMLKGDAQIIEQQNVAETIQFNAMVPFVEPENETVDTPTVQGVLTTASMILQGTNMLAALKDAGMGVQVIKPITTNYIQNEKEKWENVPSFDLVICHKRSLVHGVGRVEKITSGLYRV